MALTQVQTGMLQDGAVTPAKLSQPLTSDTAKASTSGTNVDFTGIPSWAKRITVMFNGMSTNGASNYQVQLGSGSITTTGYASVSSVTGGGTAITPTAVVTSGMVIQNPDAATGSICSGHMLLTLVSGNIWVQSHTYAGTATARTGMGGGNVTLSGVLDRLRITTVNGTDTFDAGSINILYE